MASTCTECRRIIIDPRRRTQQVTTKTVVIAGRPLTFDHTSYQHQDCAA